MLGRSLLAALVASCLLAPAASAAPASVLGGAAPCAPAEGVVQCTGIVESFDGALIDVNVTLPADASGPLPLLGRFHGWGGSKIGLGDTKRWAERGYAVFTMSDRGFGMSCGGQDPKRLTPECANGYVRLMDTRYEVRDYQELAGRLVDEGLVKPKKIGALGGSYGGGISMALAALKNRIMRPDGSYAPWKSPKGTPMKLAAAAPEIPWSDLAYSLAPTGRNLDYVADNAYGARAGVMKQSFVSGLFALGGVSGNYALPRQDPDADLATWYSLVSLGEPYELNPVVLDMIDELTTHHSSYYVEPDRRPAPLLINNGWTDDLFPADEAVRFYNRTRTKWPKAKIAMYHMDNGHQRGQNRPEDKERLAAAQREWLDHYLLGTGKKPYQGVRALTIACGDAKSEGPYAAKSWRKISPGELRLSDETTRPVVSGGDPQASKAYDPITGGGACATASGDDQPGTASYRIPVEREGGVTVLGSPTVIADIAAPNPGSQVAARLLDVDPATGDATLIARGLYRPDASGRQVFQLHPSGYRVARGHEIKLELLSHDLLYGRPSNAGATVTVSDLELRVPVAEKAGAGVAKPAAKVLPKGTKLAFGYKKFQKRALRRGR